MGILQQLLGYKLQHRALVLKGQVVQLATDQDRVAYRPIGVDRYFTFRHPLRHQGGIGQRLPDRCGGRVNFNCFVYYHVSGRQIKFMLELDFSVAAQRTKAALNSFKAAASVITIQ